MKYDDDCSIQKLSSCLISNYLLARRGNHFFFIYIYSSVEKGVYEYLIKLMYLHNKLYYVLYKICLLFTIYKQAFLFDPM